MTTAPTPLYFEGITPAFLDRRAVRRCGSIPRTARGFFSYSVSGHRERQMQRRLNTRLTGRATMDHTK